MGHLADAVLQHGGKAVGVIPEVLVQKDVARESLLPCMLGRVLSGEIGDIKREIVYNGDTVITAARIRTMCTTFNKDLLRSADLLNRLPQVEYLSPEPIGKIKLRGKQEDPT